VKWIVCCYRLVTAEGAATQSKESELFVPDSSLALFQAPAAHVPHPSCTLLCRGSAVATVRYVSVSLTI
jgi:hypothetical protein